MLIALYLLLYCLLDTRPLEYVSKVAAVVVIAYHVTCIMVPIRYWFVGKQIGKYEGKTLFFC